MQSAIASGLYLKIVTYFQISNSILIWVVMKILMFPK